jgi:hypothetical protein
MDILNKAVSKSNRRRTRMRIALKKPKLDSFIIAISFLISGIIFFDISFIYNSQIVCFIGLGLTFWGALFLLITPQKQVESSFLVTSTLPAYMTIDRLLKDLKPKNEAYNVPSHNKDIYLPKQLKDLKEMVTFIPIEDKTATVENEDLTKGKFLTGTKKGLLVAPPGIAILNEVEQKLNLDFAEIPFSELIAELPTLLNGLYLAKQISMNANESDVSLRITGSLYKTLYNQEYNLKSVNLIGCPLVSAAACAIAKSTGKPTIIQKIETTPDSKTTTVILKIVQV